MRCVIQRVRSASVAVGAEIVSSIGAGMLVLAARRGGIEDRRALAWAIGNAPRSDLLRVALWMFQSEDREVQQELLRASHAFSPLPARFVSRTVALLVDPVLRPENFGLDQSVVLQACPLPRADRRFTHAPRSPLLLRGIGSLHPGQCVRSDTSPPLAPASYLVAVVAPRRPLQVS